jgi:RimJ/RimL family protein N-acetyltransferase
MGVDQAFCQGRAKAVGRDTRRQGETVRPSFRCNAQRYTPDGRAKQSGRVSVVMPSVTCRTVSLVRPYGSHTLSRCRSMVCFALPAGETTNLVLALGQRLIGLAAAGPARDGDCDPLRTREVYAIYLRSEYWGQGHGKALYFAIENQMRRSDAIDAVLWVLRDNARARRFYEAQGFTLDQSCPERNHDGDPSLVEVRYRKAL